MKKLMLAAAIVVSFLSASTSNAQLTGPSTLNVIRDDFSKDGYTVVMDADNIQMKDGAGNTVFTVTQVNPQTITLSSVVARLHGLTSEQSDLLQKRIAFFNFSSAVGTLWFDNATGEITMEHHLNPRYVSSSAIVKVAASFGDMVRTEERTLMQ